MARFDSASIHGMVEANIEIAIVAVVLRSVGALRFENAVAASAKDTGLMALYVVMFRFLIPIFG